MNLFVYLTVLVIVWCI